MADPTVALDARLRALEYMLVSVFADAASQAPDIGVALKGIKDFIDIRVRMLLTEAGKAEAAQEGKGMPIAMEADALLELRNRVVHLTATAAAGTNKPAN